MIFMLINISVIISIIASLFVIKHFVNKKIITLIENRISNIDGLRGYLALGVFFHHFIITYYWQKTGIWQRSPENFYNNLAELSVSMFFMITGYLFFKVILKNDLDVKLFFKKRFFRLVPIYYFVVIIILLFVSDINIIFLKNNKVDTFTYFIIFFVYDLTGLFNLIEANK